MSEPTKEENTQDDQNLKDSDAIKVVSEKEEQAEPLVKKVIWDIEKVEKDLLAAYEKNSEKDVLAIRHAGGS